MGQDVIINLISKALMLVLTASLPPILVAVILGVAIALLQALTQIQDQTLPYAFKLTAIVLVLIFAMNIIFTDFLNFTLFLFGNFPILVRPGG